MKIKNSTLIDVLLSYGKKERFFILLVVITSVPESERRALFKKVFATLSIGERKKLSNMLTKLALGNVHWNHLNRWMETVFTKHYSLTPYKVAMMGMNYFRMNRKMKPFMIALARKVKARIRYRLNGGRTNGSCGNTGSKISTKPTQWT